MKLKWHKEFRSNFKIISSVIIVELRTVAKHFKVDLVNIVKLLHSVQTEFRKIFLC